MLRWKLFERAFETMKIQKENIVHLLFPRRCPICDNVMFSSVFLEAELCCSRCRSVPEYVKEPVCKKCGKPMEDERAELCYDCKKHPGAYVQGKALWVYKDQVKQSMYRFKYQNRQEYARFYGSEIVRVYGDWMKRSGIEAIVPIPLHRAKKRQRGYNQAELLAREIGRRTGLKVYPDLLKRVRKTKPQKKLNDAERKNNLKKAFKTQENKVQLNHILLVDDIYTTGSTINEAALELRRAGIEQVYYVSVCIGRGY